MFPPVTVVSQGRAREEIRIPRFRARSSRSVFNLLTVELISHPITQQLPPNWLRSFSYGWVCTWIYCRCAKVWAHCDCVISKGKRVCVGSLERWCSVAFSVFTGQEKQFQKIKKEGARQWDKYLQEQLNGRRPEEPQTTGRSRSEWNGKRGKAQTHRHKRNRHRMMQTENVKGMPGLHISDQHQWQLLSTNSQKKSCGFYQHLKWILFSDITIPQGEEAN